MRSDQLPPLPLSGLKVIDLTQVMAGPYCTMLLGDLGADVIKVEPPEGDQTRTAMRGAIPGVDSIGFLQLNRNKRSLALDLKTDAGRRILHQLVRDADILIENGRPGVADRLGYGWKALQQINPRLVYASISGFGQSGPWSRRPGFDMIAQAMSGVMSVSGFPDQPPCRNTISAADLGSALMALYAILSAVIGRQASGQGQYIDVSLFDSILGLSIWEASEFWETGDVPRPNGSANRMSAPYQAVKAGDGYFVLGAANPKLWRTLCETVERPDLMTDPRFVDANARLSNRVALIDELEAVFAARTAAEWVELLLERGIPAGEIMNYAESLGSAHARERSMVVEGQHPRRGAFNMLGFPVKLSATPAGLHRNPPTLGQHREEILAACGYTAEQIRALDEQGAFGAKR